MDKTNPNIYDTITAIQLEQEKTELSMIESLKGVPARKRPSYQGFKEDQIVQILKNYNQYSLFEICDWVASVLDTGVYRYV